MDERITWLRAQLDTDERLATEAGYRSPSWPVGGTWWLEGVEHNVVGREEAFCHPHNVAHIANNDPDRALRQVQAHRAILDEYEHQVAKAEENSRKFVAMTKSPSLDQQEFTNVKTHGWELSGRVAALRFAVDTLLAIYSDRDGYKEEWSR